MRDVFIIGAKGIGNYGGYETFVKRLIENNDNDDKVKLHISCKYNGQGAMDESKLKDAIVLDDCHFIYRNAECFKIKVPEWLGPAQAIYYDIAAIKECIKQIKKKNISHPIVYVLACRIGPFVGKYVKQLHKLGGSFFVNPDGHEWMRAKWPKPVRKYWKISEAGMIKYADLVICDSINIEKYIKTTYKKYNPQTAFIAYGADLSRSKLNDSSEEVRSWYSKHHVKKGNYFLIVGRFVPENNYKTMITEFMKSKVKKDLVIITNVEHNDFYKSLKEQTRFDKDSRIKFVGTVYNPQLLKYIRENAFGYLHGHSVGGTNPSLLEALSSTKLNLLYDVGFNREVAENAAFYWNKESNNLSKLIDNCDGKLSQAQVDELGKAATKRIEEHYSWNQIVDKYKSTFVNRG